MGALVDSSVLVAGERGSLDLDSMLTEQAEESLAISAVTASELLHGVHRAKGATRRARREAFVEAVLSRLPIISFDAVAARSHARLWAQLANQGTMVGAHDLIIASTALSRGLDVVTRDERSFPRIPGIRVIRW